MSCRIVPSLNALCLVIALLTGCAAPAAPGTPATPADASAYLAWRGLDDVAARGNAAAVDALEKACAHASPLVRQRALTHLARLAPARGHAQLLKATRDDSRWVRLHAAALLASHSRPGDEVTLTIARSAERDPVIQAYLDDAFARAIGRTAPAPGAAQPADGQDVSEDTRSAAPGHVVVDAPVHPGRLVLQPDAADAVIRALDKLLPAEVLSNLAEITLAPGAQAVPAALWETAWRAFCIETGIDPKAIAGNQDRLSQNAREAWENDWAPARTAEGLALLHRYLQLRLDKLRPGLKVSVDQPWEGED